MQQFPSSPSQGSSRVTVQRRVSGSWRWHCPAPRFPELPTDFEFSGDNSRIQTAPWLRWGTAWHASLQEIPDSGSAASLCFLPLRAPAAGCTSCSPVQRVGRSLHPPGRGTSSPSWPDPPEGFALTQPDPPRQSSRGETPPPPAPPGTRLPCPPLPAPQERARAVWKAFPTCFLPPRAAGGTRRPPLLRLKTLLGGHGDRPNRGLHKRRPGLARSRLRSASAAAGAGWRLWGAGGGRQAGDFGGLGAGGRALSLCFAAQALSTQLRGLATFLRKLP